MLIAELAITLGGRAKIRSGLTASAMPIGWEKASPRSEKPTAIASGTAERAQVVKRVSQQEKESGQEHVCGAGDPGTQHRRVKCKEQCGGNCGAEGLSAAAQGEIPDSGKKPDHRGRKQGRCRGARRREKLQGRRNEKGNRRI
jgi:hypothetical protein